jgi:hypothetical protein
MTRTASQTKKTAKRAEEEGPAWHMTVRNMPHKEGFSYPVFQWSYGFKKGLRGGELRVWPLQEILVFEARRGEGPFIFHTIEEAMVKVNEYGWGEPPHLQEVFLDAQKLKANPPKNIKELKNFFAELKRKWEELAKQ